MDDMLGTLRAVLAERSRDLPDDDFRLRSLWSVDYRSQPTDYERFMVYSFVLAQTVRQGCCYADFGTVRIGEASDGLIGKDARLVRGSTREEDIAILDAAFGALPRTPAEVLTIDGPPEEKALARARTVVGETMRLLNRSPGRKVAQIGVMGNLIHHLQREDVDLTASDFDPHLIENGILGVPVYSGDESARLVAESDVALVCGETLASHTLEELVETAAEHDTRLVVFAVTGCHFAQEYCGTFGIDTVMAEPQPQYLFQGPRPWRSTGRTPSGAPPSSPLNRYRPTTPPGRALHRGCSAHPAGRAAVGQHWYCGVRHSLLQRRTPHPPWGYLSLVPMALAYHLLGRGLILVAAGTAATLILVEPVTSAVVSVVVADERLAPVSDYSSSTTVSNVRTCLIDPNRQSPGPT